MNGVALKVTYNDGGANGGLFGYRGVCSNRIIFDNVQTRRMTNCSAEDHPCRKFVDGGLRGRRPNPDAPHCYESVLFAEKHRRFWCGMYHHGPKEGEPIPIRGVEAGDIAFLTTILPIDILASLSTSVIPLPLLVG